MYSTRKQIKEVYPLLDDFNLDNAGITAFITRADNFINAKLAEKYTVPFSGTPPLINDVSKNLTLAFILQRHYTQQIPNQNDWVVDMREEVKETITALADGSMTIVGSDGTIIEQRADRQQLLSTTIDWNPVFDMRDIAFQHTDPDRLDAEDAADS